MAADETADDARTETSADSTKTDATQTEADGAPTDAGAPPAETVGRFRIEGRLGSGGMAHVYRAYDPTLDRAVALKVLRVKDDTTDETRLRRVLREARAAASLTHPNTVTIFEVGEADGEVFIAMELLAGETLRARMRRRDADFALKLRWLTEAASALSAAHARGLVHRDIKPENMFISTPGDGLKLLDFGIAKRDDDSKQAADRGGSNQAQPDSIGPSSLRTEMGARAGTPRYMAPEQRAGEPTDARTDQYAWGLVAFELFVGTHPIAALETVPRAGSGGTPAISAENVATTLTGAQIPPHLAAAITRALAPRKDDRFPSVSALLEALREPDPATPEKEKNSRRWPLAAALVAIAGIVAGGIAVRHRAHPTETAAAPACHIGAVRTFPIGEDDRIAALENGDIVIARDIKKGLTITRPGLDGGAVTTHRDGRLLLDIFQGNADYEDVLLSGIRLTDGPWLLASINQGVDRGIFAVGLSEHSYFAQRLRAPISGLAALPLGKDRVVFGATSLDAGPTFTDSQNAAEIYILDGKTTPQPISVERGEGIAPAIATSADDTRIAFAYALVETAPKPHEKLRLAILDETGDRVSDIKTIYEAPLIYPAVAFAGRATAIVLWVDDVKGATRLWSSTFTPGDATPTPPKTAIDEPALFYRPITARLPGGNWAAVWVASQKNTPTLRIAPIASSGALEGATNVATLPAKFDHLAVSSGEHGIYLSWRELAAGAAPVAKIADITCP